MKMNVRLIENKEKNIQGENIKEEQKTEINENCSILELEGEILLKRRFNYIAKSYGLFIIIFAILTPVLFLLTLLFSLAESIIFLVFMLILTSPFLIVYLIFKNREIEWEFNKVSQKIFYRKTSRKLKLRKELNFNDIQYFIYHTHKHSDSALSPRTYSLHLSLRSQKEITIFVGEERECKKLGKRIAIFLDKPLIFYPGGWRERII